MISILNFLLEASLCLFGFFALYFLLFRKDNQLNFRRFYILSAVGVSLLVPLIEFETPLVWLENTGQTAVGTVEPDGGQLFTMPEITILAREEGEKAGTDLWLYVISLSFIAFSSVILFRFLRQVFFVLRIRFDRRFHRIKEKDHTVVYTRGLLPTFSFLKTVFINEAEIKEEGELS
ncbi:MAG: hypothetical protein OEX02_12980, partial [Cyclobacteriaceae bacterium]|nr:hypothetical protein [Cyclobacteriaceae bacterium]